MATLYKGDLNIAFDKSSMVGAGKDYLGNASVSVRIVVDVISQSVETKSAQVKFRLEAYKLNNAFYNYSSVNGYLYAKGTNIQVNGVTATSSTETKYTSITGGSYAGTGSGKWYQELQNTITLWSSDTYTIYYDSNDVANVSINANLSFELTTEYGLEQSTWYAKVDNTQYSTNFDLPDLPRYAAIYSVPTSFTDEANPKVYYSVPKGTTNIELGILFSDNTVAVPYRTVNNTSGSYTFNLTADERESLYSILQKGLSSTTVYFAIKSYYPDTNTSYLKTKSSTLTVINYMPTMDPEVWDTNATTKALTGNQYKLIKYFSKAAFDVHAEAKKGAGIDSITVTNGDRTTSNLNHVFDNIISSLFSFSVTDTFGRSVSGDMELSPSNWVEYVKLTSSIKLSDMAADGDVKVTVSGKYFKGSFGSQSNTLSFVCTAVPTRGDTVTKTISNVSPTMSGNNYTYEFTLEGLSYTNAYTITVTATDKLMSVTSGSSVVAPEPIFDWGREDFNFNVPVNVNGEITAESIKIGTASVPSIVEQGTSGDWTFRKWSDGVYECWARKQVSAINISTAWGNLYTSGGVSGTNLTFPITFISVPVVNASLTVMSAGAILVPPGGTSNLTSTTKTGAFEFVRPSTLTGATFAINYQVRGRWK